MKVAALLFLTVVTCGFIRAAETGPLVVERHGLAVAAEGVPDDLRRDLAEVIDLQLTLVEDTTPTAPLADDLAFFVRKELLRLGLPDAAVTWDIAGGRVVLTIAAGSRAGVGATDFPGATAATPEELRAMLLRPTRERTGQRDRRLPFVAAEIRQGAELVRRLLQSRGHLAAAVAEPDFSTAPDGSTDITVRVTEGPRSTFGPVVVRGPLPPEAASARDDAAAIEGEAFSEVRMEEIRARVQSKCTAAGRFGAVVTAAAHPSPGGGAVPVVLSVEPGPVFSIRTLDIAEDFSRGARRLIEAAFRPAEGDVWSTEALDLMQRRVMDSGVLSAVDTEPVRIAGDDAGLALRITGREAPRRTLAVFGGYETLRGPILGVEWRHVNILDTGNTLRLRAGWEAGGPEGSLRWIDPAILGSRWTSDTELAALHATAWNYTHDSLRLRSALSRQFTRQFAASLFVAASADSAGGGGLTPEELGPSSYQTWSAGLLASLDRRDSPVVPHRGWFTSAEVEMGNADVPFVRSRLRFSWYRPVTDRFRVAFNWQAAAVHVPDGIRRLPIDQRVFNGGASTVRSFGERDLGPRSDGGTPLGGAVMHALNAEASWTLLTNLELAVFADTGSLSQESGHPFAVPDDLRHAVGAGLRYALPVGPLRLDYGFNPSRRAGEPRGAFHATFGFPF